MNEKENIYSKIVKSGNFPALPEILTKLLDACEDEERPLSEIADIISKDPILSFKVLQLVNSAYYGLRHTFTGIEQAVIYLGSNSIKNIAVATAIYQVFEYEKIKKIRRFSWREFWWHSLLCATMAKRIARMIEFANVDEAYLSGLLHDIGRIVLLSTFPQEHETILEKTENSENVLWAEKQLIGVTHCEVGAWLVRKWQLTSLMADAIKYHHQPLERIAESFPLIKIVYFANLLTQEQDEGNIHEAGDVLFELGQVEIAELVSGATEEVEQIAHSLGIRIRQSKAAAKPQEKNKATIVPYEGGNCGRADISSKADMRETGQESDFEAEKELRIRVRNISLLSGFLEELMKAEGREKMIEVFERSVNVLFDLKKVLFFLPDKQQVLLKGTTSASNPYRQMSRDLIMPIKRLSSRLVKAYHGVESDCLERNGKSLSTADEQVLAVLNAQSALIIPIKADSKPVGLILLGEPDDGLDLTESDMKLLQIIARQLGLCLYLERMKKEKEAEIESERQAAISMTARKFAHEVNNPLGIISNYLTSLKLKLAGDKNIEVELGVIGEEIQRISSMVNQLDLFSQPIPSATKDIDVNGELGKIIKLLRPSLFKNSATTVSFHPQQQLPPLQTSLDGFKQIVINLLKNGVEAMPDGGDIVVTTREVTADDSVAQAAGIEVSISDNGPGLPDAVRENLYKPFVTTKSGNHAGLGLSIVNNAVQSLGGEIRCISDSKQGTIFTLFFPLHNQ
ncbi:MAG TPA: HDOD domain-containing protein [Desulfopila sp.]|nr:HDOD domain-containing protein [Desulfopila sp.]